RERPGVGAAIQRLQDRRLDFDILEAIEISPDRAHQPCPGAKHLAHFGMHGQIGIALPVPLLRVSEPGVSDRDAVDDFFFAVWQWPKGFRQQLSLLHSNRDFAGLRAKELAAHANDIAQVKPLETVPGFIAQDITAKIELDTPRGVSDMGKCGFAGATPRHEASRDSHHLSMRLPRQVLTRSQRRCRGVLAIVLVGVLRHARGDQRIELVPPRTLHEIPFVIHHYAASRLRYASMNGSMAPSMTFCTSGILSSVR